MTICVGFRRTHLGNRFHRRRCAIRLDAQRIDQARIGPAGANAGQRVLEHIDGLFHPLFGVQKNIVGRHSRDEGRGTRGEEKATALRFSIPFRTAISR